MVKQCLTTVGHLVGVAILAVLTAAILAGPTLLFAAICGFGTWLLGCDTVIVVVFANHGRHLWHLLHPSAQCGLRSGRSR